jgi:hypothetical protein
MPHVKVSMLPIYSRTAQLPTNQEAQQVPDNRGHAWKFQHGKWIILNSRLTLNFGSNSQNQQQMLHTILDAVHNFGRSLANIQCQGPWHLIGITGSKLDMNHWRTNSAMASLQGTRTKCQRYRRLFTVAYGTNDHKGVNCTIC